MAGAPQISDQEALIRGAGFEAVEVALKEESKSVIAQWMPGSGAEDYVSSANVTARKAAGYVNIVNANDAEVEVVQVADPFGLTALGGAGDHGHGHGSSAVCATDADHGHGHGSAAMCVDDADDEVEVVQVADPFGLAALAGQTAAATAATGSRRGGARSSIEGCCDTAADGGGGRSSTTDGDC